MLSEQAPFAGRWSTHRVYGVALRTNFRFRNRLAAAPAPPDVTFSCRVDPHDGPAGELLWPSDAQARISLRMTGTAPVLRFAGSSSFELHEDRIDCRLCAPHHAYLVEIQLLGMVLALWLEQRGTPVLHASAVDVDGRGVAFVGVKGAGKTSMAATFAQHGSPVITEDLLALSPAGGENLAQPGHPQMRMWPDEARHFLGGLDGLEVVHPAFTKLRVPVGPSGIGCLAPHPRPLGALYLLDRGPAGGNAAVGFTAVTAGQAMIELVRHSFVPELVAALGLHARRLSALARIAGRVPVFRLRYPAGLEHLPATRRAVLRHLDGVDDVGLSV